MHLILQLVLSCNLVLRFYRCHVEAEHQTAALHFAEREWDFLDFCIAKEHYVGTLGTWTELCKLYRKLAFSVDF